MLPTAQGLDCGAAPVVAGRARRGAPWLFAGLRGSSGTRVEKPSKGFRAERGGLMLLLTVLGFFMLSVILHYPGAMNNDSVGQYQQAVDGRYTDWHPPVMAWLWSRLRLVADGPAPLLLVHLAAYWGGFALLADGLRRSGSRHPHVALLVMLAAAFPPFLVMNANLTKDVGMAVSWMGAIGLMFWYRAQDRRIPLLWGGVAAALIVYGTLVRSNAVFALGPLLVYAFAPAGWLRGGRLIVAAMVIAVLAIPIAQEANRRLFDPTPMSPVNSLFLFDLVGVAAHARDPSLVLPRASVSTRQLEACYTPYWWDPFSPWGVCAALLNRTEGSIAGTGEGLAAQWGKTILAHPLDYAIHRLKHFNSSLLFAVPLKHNRLAPEFRGDDPSFKPLGTATDRDIRMDLVIKNPLVWPATWMMWAATLLVFAGRQPPAAPVLLARVLVVSALGYSGAYLLIGVATDLRYHYWSQIAVLVASLLVLPELAKGLRARSPPLLAGLAGVALVIVIGLATRLLDFQGFVT